MEWKRKKSSPISFLFLEKITNKRKKNWQDNTVFNNVPSDLSQNWHPFALSYVGAEAVLKAGSRP